MAEFDIELNNLTMRYGDFTAVQSLNLTVAAGTIFGFLGPNGSGKSTTIRMLTGQLTPTFGDAIIAGRSIRSAPIEVKQMIGVLPEDLGLFRALTISEHLLMSGAVYRLGAAETRERSEQLLKFVDLWEDRATYVESASYGMRKKCALAMALIHNPRVLFLDEPFEGIDPGSARNIKDLLLLMAAKGKTIFLTSHILETMEQLITGFAIIKQGEIVAQDTIAALKSSRRSLEDIYFQHVQKLVTEELKWLA